MLLEIMLFYRHVRINIATDSICFPETSTAPGYNQHIQLERIIHKQSANPKNIVDIKIKLQYCDDLSLPEKPKHQRIAAK